MFPRGTPPKKGNVPTPFNPLEPNETPTQAAFNESLDDYKRLASKAENASHNLTKFKALVEACSLLLLGPCVAP